MITKKPLFALVLVSCSLFGCGANDGVLPSGDSEPQAEPKETKNSQATPASARGLVDSCRILRDGEEETISTSTVICGRAYFDTKLTITGDGINVTTDGGMVMLIGSGSHLTLQNLKSSTIFGIYVESAGVRRGPWDIFSKVISLINASNNRLIFLSGACPSASSTCIPLQLESGPNNNNIVESFYGYNGYMGIYVAQGTGNLFKGSVSGVTGTRYGSPWCWSDSPGTNTFRLTNCSF